MTLAALLCLDLGCPDPNPRAPPEPRVHFGARPRRALTPFCVTPRAPRRPIKKVGPQSKFSRSSAGSAPAAPHQFARFPAPIAAKTGTMPAHERLGPDDRDGLED